jgi:pyrroloquinoline quinone (PQQ) biosynthesis protein C
MLGVEETLREVKRLHKILPFNTHPLWQGLVEGAFSQKQAQEFARQFGIIPLHNHNYHGRLYVICPDMGWRERLAEVVYEEGTGRLFANGISHNKLYLQFGAELGLSAAELLNVNYCPEAAAFKTFFQDRCSHNIVEGISCHMLAAEAQGPGLYMHLAERLKKDFGMSDAGVAFWVIHDVADTDHSSVGEELLADFAKTEADRQLVIKTVRETLEATQLLYNGILARVKQAA